MKKLILILAVFLSFPVFAAKQKEGIKYEAEIIKVSDGDTIVIAAPYLPAPIKPQLAVRIYGVDTPEKGWRGKCDKEKEMGERASQFTKDMVKAGTQFHVILYGWDKFGGRVLGDILVDGVSVRHSLISNGLAREYYGEAKESWCN
jgi:endonuclease YncB( thermonuclease family)